MKKSIPTDGVFTRITAFFRKCLPSTNKKPDVDEVDKSTSTSEVVQASSNEPNNLYNHKVSPTTKGSEDKIFYQQKVVNPPSTHDELNEKLKSQVHLLLEQVSLLSPPDIAGTICDELERYERRPVPELRPLTALAALSMANYNRKAYGGGNLHFQGLGVAKSSSGKEAHIGFTKKLLAGIGLADKVATKPRSDKNIYLDLIDNEY
jgi:hypothetical protein